MDWDNSTFCITKIPTSLDIPSIAEWLSKALKIDASSMKIHFYFHRTLPSGYSIAQFTPEQKGSVSLLIPI